MTPYPAYKPIGLPWLPQIPDHWKIVRNKNILIEKTDVVGKNSSNYTLLSLTLSGVIPRDMENCKGKFPAEFDAYKIVQQGDIIFCLFDLDETPRTVGLSLNDGMITGAYDVFSIRGVNPKFIYYYYLNVDNKKALKPYYTGLRKVVNVSRFLELRFPVPPPDEQTQIVRYLDSMTAKINKLIRAKKKVCDLIFEEIIQRTNVHINNKNTAHFRLKNVIKLVSDEIVRVDDELYTPLGVLNRGRGVFHKKQLLGKDLGDSIFYHVFPGDIIFSGQFAWEGAVAILQKSEEGCVASHRYPLVRAINPDILNLKYLWAFFQTKYGDMLLNLHSHGAAGRNRPLNIMRLLGETIPVPSPEEQQKIEKLFLQLQEAKTLAVKYSVELQEYKNSLISSVVTGQVDIRDIPVDDFDPADLVSEAEDTLNGETEIAEGLEE